MGGENLAAFRGAECIRRACWTADSGRKVLARPMASGYALFLTGEKKAQQSGDFTELSTPAALLGQLRYLFKNVDSYPGAPTVAQSEQILRHGSEMEETSRRLDQVLDTEIKPSNGTLRSAGVQGIEVHSSAKIC